MTRRIAIVILLLLAAAAWFSYLAVYQVDDAFIVYRYSENIAGGNGFVYNVGERVEGVTCLLWTMTLACVAFLGLPLPSAAPVLTALAGAALLLLLPWAAARWNGRNAPDGWDFAVPFLLLAHPSFAYWSVGALETVPYTLLLLLAAHAHNREMERRPGYWSAVWMVLAMLTRPEAVLLSVAFVVDRLSVRRLKRTVMWCAITAGLFMVFLVFRSVYFGDWLPNTYYAKSGNGWHYNLVQGWDYTREFFSSMAFDFGAWTIWTEALGSLFFLGAIAYGLARRTLRAPALLCLLLGFAILVEGRDWMVLSRFWVPAIPFLLVLLVAGARAAAGRARWLLPLAAAAGLVWIASGLVSGIERRDGPNGLVVNHEGYQHAHREVGRYLKEHGRTGDAVALMDIGLIGYESGLRVIDISGLTNSEVAKSPGGFLNKGYPVELILNERPRFIVLVPGFPIDARIAAHPEFRWQYRFLFKKDHRFNRPPPESPYLLHVFERNHDR